MNLNKKDLVEMFAGVPEQYENACKILKQNSGLNGTICCLQNWALVQGTILNAVRYLVSTEEIKIFKEKFFQNRLHKKSNGDSNPEGSEQDISQIDKDRNVKDEEVKQFMETEDYKNFQEKIEVSEKVNNDGDNISLPWHMSHNP